jgi:hypothetical protein
MVKCSVEGMVKRQSMGSNVIDNLEEGSEMRVVNGSQFR